MAFFDVEASSGKLLNSLNEDTVTIQNAIGEKVGNFVHHMSACVVGLAIGESQQCHKGHLYELLCPSFNYVLECDTCALALLVIHYARYNARSTRCKICSITVVVAAAAAAATWHAGSVLTL